MKSHVWVLASLLWIALVHATGVHGDFVFDDLSLFSGDLHQDPMGMGWFRLSDRPVGKLTFAIQFSTIGESKMACHIINIGIHLLAALAVGALTRLIAFHRFSEWSEDRVNGCAAGAMLLWGIHPVTTSAVTYIVQRYESLASCLMLWSVVCWLKAYSCRSSSTAMIARKQPALRWWIVAIMLGGLAYGCKQMSAGLPVVVLLVDRWVLRDSWKEALKHGLGIVLLAIPVCIGAIIIVPGLLRPNNSTSTIGYGLVGIDPWDYVATQALVYLRYCKIAIWPTDLVLDYGWLPVRDTATRWLGWAVWCVWWGVLALAMRWWAATGFALFVIAVVLAPTTFVPMQDVIYDHRIYLPLAIFSIVVVLFLGGRSNSHPIVRLLPASFLAGIFVLSVMTVLRNQDYSTASSLAHRDLERQPSNPRSYFRIAVNDENLSHGQRVRAMKSAINLSEERGYFYAGTRYLWPRSFADAMLHSGATIEAERWYAIALSNSETELEQAESLWALAMIAARDGDHRHANLLFQKALAFETRIKSQIQLTHDAYRKRGQFSTEN